MTNAQENEFSRAEQRLAKSGLVATTVNLGTRVVYLVPSQTKQHTNYCVYRDATKPFAPFVCGCEYGRKDGQICVHKMAAFKAERAAAKPGLVAAIKARVEAGQPVPAAARKFLDDAERDACLPLQAPQGVRTLR